MTPSPDAPKLGQHTPGPWQLVEGNENHGPYVTSNWGRDICDLYTMSNPMSAAICNGGDSKPIWFDDAAANARLIAAAPDLLAALEGLVKAVNYRDACSVSGAAAPRIADASIRLTDAIDAARAAIARARGTEAS